MSKRRLRSDMYDMVLEVKVSGNNTNPVVTVIKKDWLHSDNIPVNAFGNRIKSTDTSDLRYLYSNEIGIGIRIYRLENDIAKHISAGLDVDEVVHTVMDELYIELRILADRANLSEISYKSEHNF